MPAASERKIAVPGRTERREQRSAAKIEYFHMAVGTRTVARRTDLGNRLSRRHDRSRSKRRPLQKVRKQHTVQRTVHNAENIDLVAAAPDAAVGYAAAVAKITIIAAIRRSQHTPLAGATTVVPNGATKSAPR